MPESFDLHTRKAINYSTRDGLPSNEVLGTQTDEKGRLWITTSKGLAYIVNGGKEDAKVFRIGFFDQEIKDISRYSFSKLGKGVFAHGSTGGAFIFHASDIKNKPYAAPLHFTSFEMIKNIQRQSPEREKEYTEMLHSGKMLNLAYDENAFIISFTSVNFENQEDILYSYKMEGVDESWSVPDMVQQIRYTNIPPGDYTFTVKGISQNTGNVLDTRSLPIHIAQPYWNTPYAWFVYGLLMLGFVWFTWRYFANRIARKHFAEKIDFTRALGTLRPEERMALSLFDLEAMPIAKIASVMERTEGSVKTLLFRGKQHVSEYFKQDRYERDE